MAPDGAVPHHGTGLGRPGKTPGGWRLRSQTHHNRAPVPGVGPTDSPKKAPSRPFGFRSRRRLTTPIGRRFGASEPSVDYAPVPPPAGELVVVVVPAPDVVVVVDPEPDPDPDPGVVVVVVVVVGAMSGTGLVAWMTWLPGGTAGGPTGLAAR